MKITLIIIITILIFGCAVYDSKRGIFVTSTVQEVNVSNIDKDRIIEISAFSYSGKGLSDTQQNTLNVSGAFIPASHTYVFDEVDKNNLRKSIILSFKMNGVHVVDLMTEPPKNNAAAMHIDIDFDRIGMASGSMGSVCIITADITISVNDVNTKNRVDVPGKVKFTIAETKNYSIREFVKKLSVILEHAEL